MKPQISYSENSQITNKYDASKKFVQYYKVPYTLLNKS